MGANPVTAAIDWVNGPRRTVDWVLVDGVVAGSGETYDWNELKAPKGASRKGWILLAGGLDPENVSEAIMTSPAHRRRRRIRGHEGGGRAEGSDARGSVHRQRESSLRETRVRRVETRRDASETHGVKECVTTREIVSQVSYDKLNRATTGL